MVKVPFSDTCAWVTHVLYVVMLASYMWTIHKETTIATHQLGSSISTGLEQDLGLLKHHETLPLPPWPVWQVNLIGWSSKALRDKLLEGCYTVQRRLKVAAIVATSRTEFYLLQRCTQQKCCNTSCRGNTLHRAILQQLVSQRRCKTSCWENCSVTAPLGYFASMMVWF